MSNNKTPELVSVASALSEVSARHRPARHKQNKTSDIPKCLCDKPLETIMMAGNESYACTTCRVHLPKKVKHQVVPVDTVNPFHVLLRD